MMLPSDLAGLPGLSFSNSTEECGPVANIPSQNELDFETNIITLRHQFPSDIIGLPIVDPLLTWQCDSSRSDAKQVAYEISSTDERGHVNSSAIVESADSIEIKAVGHISSPRERRDFRVRIATQYGWTEHSPSIIFETGLNSGNELMGESIGDDSLHSEPSPILRKTFVAGKVVKKARLYATSEGLYSMFVNSVPVGEEFFTPGWTAFDKRLTYQTYDVTSLIQEGTNCIGAALADGWTRGKFGFTNNYDNYGNKIHLLAQLEILYTDDTREVIVTDKSWKVSSAEVRFADIYDGCTIDQNFAQHGWQNVEFDDAHWKQVTVHSLDKKRIQARTSTRVLKVAEFAARIIDTNNRTLLDFSQNISGWVRICVDGKKGDEITIRHAEVLESGPHLHTAALRTARATDRFMLASDGRHVLEPRFTFHGFQFAEVTGNAQFISAVGVAVSSAHERIGHFSSSDTRLNRLHENVVWSVADNMVSVPTDCPQRDERLGWTGDAQVISFTSNTLYKLDSFWRSWLTDLWLDQEKFGEVGAVVPDILSRQAAGINDWVITNRAGWADAATIVPIASYESYGSLETLRQQLPSIRKYIKSLSDHRKGEKFLPEEFQFGDWCDPDAPGDQPWLSKVKPQFVANAFFANSAQLAADIEKLVGDLSYHTEFQELAESLKRDIWVRFGQEAKKTTAGCSMALEFGIVPDNERANVAKILSDMVLKDEGKITTGFLGTPLILHALSKNGYFKAAYTMLMRRKVRSWLYQVDNKATTIWERWDAIREDGSIHRGEMRMSDEDKSEDGSESPSMISFNHYAYGAVIDWVYRNVAGIAPNLDAPGYRQIILAPRPAQGFTFASATINTPLGAASIKWNLLGEDSLSANIVVPFGATATIDFPTSAGSQLRLNGKKIVNGHQITHGKYLVTLSNPEIISFNSAN
jgi:alpha-L-rhamnosidase